MREAWRTTVTCQNPGDGGGGIVDLPSDLLESMSLDIGDSLSTEVVNEPIVLRPIRDKDTDS